MALTLFGHPFASGEGVAEQGERHRGAA